MKKFYFVISVGILAVMASPLMADISTSEAGFVATLQPGYYLQNLQNLTVQSGFGPGPASMNFGPTNGFSWNVTATNPYPDPTGLYEVSGGLSTWFSYDVLTFTFTGSPTLVTAVGGTFFANDNGGNTINSNVEVKLNDGTSVTLNTPGFRGFTSGVGIASMTVWSDVGTASHTDGTAYAGVGELYVGAVPDGGMTIMLLGGALVGLETLRRRFRA